jgi:DNA-binding LytR/AlgR family response regulator
MEIFNCLIVEDEPLAAEVLEDYIARIPFLHCKAVCRDAIFALRFLQQEKADVLFLDIHLPQIKGLDFLRTLSKPPQVIITTAHREYAIDGYELNVVDYLLKPISFSRFLAAVNKIKASPEAALTKEPPHLFVNINKKRVKIFLQDILFIESRREYVHIFTKDNSFVTKLTISETEAQLKDTKLVRVHRSFIAAMDKITAFNATTIEINNHKIPIGRSYRDIVQELLKYNK